MDESTVLPVQLYKRREVIRRLHQAIAACRLVVVTSPIGYGKTNIARSLVGEVKSDAYLFTVSEDAHDVDALWDSLWLAMETQGMKTAPALRRLPFPDTPARVKKVCAVLETTSPTLVVVDDFHRCPAPVVDSFLETMVRAPTSMVRFAVFSRTVPEMGLEELQVKGMAAVFNQRLLAFTEIETIEFFQINGADESRARDAWQYSEGWVAVLCLYLDAIQQNKPTPPTRSVDTLLDAAVFSRLPQTDRNFLIQVSLLDNFTASDAAKLTMDRGASLHLARLFNENVSLYFDPMRRTYRFHHLFRVYLQRRLVEADGINLPVLYRRAAECHAVRRRFPSAYRLLVKAGRQEDTMRLLALLAEQGGERTEDGDWQEIHAIVQAIPWQLRLLYPSGYIAYLWLYLLSHGNNHNAEMLRDAERHFSNVATMPPVIQKRVTGALEFLKAFIETTDIRAVEMNFLNAYELLAGRPFLDFKRLSWSLSCPCISYIGHSRSGDFLLFRNLVEKHWEKTVGLTDGAAVGIQLATAAEYHLERGEFEEAERPLAVLECLVDKREHVNSFVIGSFARARLLLVEGRRSEAVRMLVDSAPYVAETGLFEHIQCHDLALGYIIATTGGEQEIPSWLADGNIHAPPYGAVYIQPFIHTVYGKVLLARGRYGELEKLTECFPGVTPFSVIHRELFTAIVRHRRHDTEAALTALRTAVDISRPDGIVLSIAEYGSQVLPLLRRLRIRHPDDLHLERIISVCTRFSRGLDGSKKYMKSYLTAREKKIMRLVSKGMTTATIARHLGVAQVTVKKALSLVYDKLGASNRAEAAMLFERQYARRVVNEARHKNPDPSRPRRIPLPKGI
ncbi:MAG: LuxR C-terminal-related transcriptional regulator [Planctomycetaceae bacterium]|nr:LuxR C-terminal-related transcriptional regulator [Planctomycetaceae bacterium]